MPLPDTLYCAQQINIPPKLPDILKNFTKAAIRTQPKDLLQWCSAYFNALAKGECLPVKERLEMNVATQKTDTGLTPGLLKILHKQLSPRQTCSKRELQTKWKGLCLPMEQLENLLSLGSFHSEIAWMEFFALGCSALGGTLMSSMKYACEILTNDEEGGPARIPFETFTQLYTYLAHLDGDVSQDHVENFLHSLQPQVNTQNGMIQVSNFYAGRMFEKPKFIYHPRNISVCSLTTAGLSSSVVMLLEQMKKKTGTQGKLQNSVKQEREENVDKDPLLVFLCVAVVSQFSGAIQDGMIKPVNFIYVDDMATTPSGPSRTSRAE